ncbi:MAG: hypothetical protein K0R78_576 [Pelosinus sp.]|nr:hypothetical protein [Pelosinus sp.]
MSIKQHPNGFKLDFGSTVTILTTAVADTKHCKRVNGQGIFTGVVLEESELRLKRSPKHVLISVDGLNEFQDATKTEGEDCCCHEHKCDDKQNDGEGNKPYSKKDYDGNKPYCEKDYDGHKDDYQCEVKTTQEFVILSLTCPSFPFSPGQIVWISIDQIIALSVLCRN